MSPLDSDQSKVESKARPSFVPGMHLGNNPIEFSEKTLREDSPAFTESRREIFAPTVARPAGRERARRRTRRRFSAGADRGPGIVAGPDSRGGPGVSRSPGFKGLTRKADDDDDALAAVPRSGTVKCGIRQAGSHRPRVTGGEQLRGGNPKTFPPAGTTPDDWASVPVKRIRPPEEYEIKT